MSKTPSGALSLMCFPTCLKKTLKRIYHFLQGVLEIPSDPSHVLYEPFLPALQGTLPRWPCCHGRQDHFSSWKQTACLESPSDSSFFHILQNLWYVCRSFEPLSPKPRLVTQGRACASNPTRCYPGNEYQVTQVSGSTKHRLLRDCSRGWNCLPSVSLGRFPVNPNKKVMRLVESAQVF